MAKRPTKAELEAETARLVEMMRSIDDFWKPRWWPRRRAPRRDPQK